MKWILFIFPGYSYLVLWGWTMGGTSRRLKQEKELWSGLAQNVKKSEDAIMGQTHLQVKQHPDPYFDHVWF